MLVKSAYGCRPRRHGAYLLARGLHVLNPPVKDARWPGWEVIVGVEVHAQIKSRCKLFSESLANDPQAEPNTNVSPFDAAFPGTLPRLNGKCVELGVRTGIALQSDIQPRSAFDRKHYFYSDLPAGYQITQNYAPLARGGSLHLPKQGVDVRIKQVQLEQDTGKTTYDPRRKQSSIDLNRAGTGLMEIVSEPDMRSPEQAGEYIRTLQQVLRSVGSSDGNMENGSLRCDVNVSVNRAGEAPGTRCEVKNLNSVKFAQVAIRSEVLRQISLLEAGDVVKQETRGFDEETARTRSLRSKEDAPDYRYMPDPNLPPLLLSEEFVRRIRDNMPELPDAITERLVGMGLSERDVGVLMSVDAGREVGYDGVLGSGAVAYFDAVAVGREPKLVANWITNELLGQLTLRSLSFTQNPCDAERMGEFIDLIQQGSITGTAAKTLLRYMLDHPLAMQSPRALAEELGLLLADPGEAGASGGEAEMQAWCESAIEALPKEAQAVREGNVKVLNKLVGRVMKLSGGRAAAQDVKTVLGTMLRS